MKNLMVGFCLVACSVLAQERVMPGIRGKLSSCFVVVQSSGTIRPGTVLYPMKKAPGEFSSTIFTNRPYYLKHGSDKPIPITNSFNVGTRLVTKVETKHEREYSLFDGNRWLKYDFQKDTYISENDFIILAQTNIVICQPIQENVKRAEAKKEFETQQCLEQTRRTEVVSRCLSRTNTLTLAEAEAQGIDIRLREVLTIEVEQDPKYGPTSVIRRRWVLSSEPFGEKIPGLASW